MARLSHSHINGLVVVAVVLNSVIDPLIYL